MAYIGSTPTSQNFTSGTDYFNGTGSQTTFTLTRSVNSVNDIEVVINNVVQQPSTAYTLSGTTITFTSAPSSGTNNIYVRYLATNMQSFTVPANSITRTQLDSNLQAGFQGRNKIINGHMVVDQRNAGASVSLPDSNTYPIDRWIFRNGTDGTATAQQSSTVPAGAGFINSVVWTVGTADASLASSQYARIAQVIEGYNTADLQFGTSNAKSITVSFWVRSSVTGTFSVVLYNAATTRGFASNYTINAANTWEQKTITVAGCTDGVWETTNSRGLTVNFGLGAGTDYQIAAGSWVTTSSVPLASTSQTNLMATSGATFYITGVQLEEGTTATSFEREIYSVTLQKCQRYYYKLITGSGNSRVLSGYVSSTTQALYVLNMPTSMRTSPTALETNGTASHYAIAYTNTETNCSAVPSFNDSTINTVSVVGAVSSGLTAGQGCQMRYTNASAYLAVSAEL